MNTSELPREERSASIHSLPTASRFNYENLTIGEEALAAYRRELYHSTGSGYIVFRGFLDERTVRHIRGIWSSIDPRLTHKEFWLRREDVFSGCPDYYTLEPRNRTFHNFFYNVPVDEVTWAASLAVHMLRNRLSGRMSFAETFPSSGRSACYRVIITCDSSGWVQPHRDYLTKKTPFDRTNYDLTRLQATLFLSEKGVDYTGTGFALGQNDGSQIVFGDDVPVKGGDLVIWRYNNLHSVLNIKADRDQLGFMRIIYPPEIMLPPHTRTRKMMIYLRRKRVRLVQRSRQFAGSALRKLGLRS